MTETEKLELAIDALKNVARGYAEEVGGFMMEIPEWYNQVQDALRELDPEWGE